MNAKKGYDVNLFFVTLLLVSLGLIMVFSASQIIAREQFSSSFFFIQRHAVRVALGLCALLIFMRIPFGIYRRLSIWALILSVLLLVAVLVWGREVRGSSRWLPIFMFMVQPVELVKYTLVIFLASRISAGGQAVEDLRRGFLPMIGVTLLIAAITALQPNLSNALLIVALSLTVMFVGGCRLRHLLSFGLLIGAAAVPVLLSFQHVRERFHVLFDRTADLHGQGWHVNQSLIAIGSGFIFGSGPGRGHQKYSFLPDAHTDFIYSIIGEELGIIGTLSVLILFVILFGRAVRAARRSPDSFGYVLAFGIGMVIFSTAIINISMTLGLLPVAGLPLPFVSYGGSSLITSMSAVGILLNISSRGVERKKRRKAPTTAGTLRGVYARRVSAGTGS